MITAVKEANESGFSWQLIAQQVKTRNAVQCLRKWYEGCGSIVLVNHVLRHQQACWKSTGEKLIKWSRNDDMRLMQELVQICNSGRG